MVTVQNNSSGATVQPTFIKAGIHGSKSATPTHFEPQFLKTKAQLFNNQQRLHLMSSLKKGWDGEEAGEISSITLQHLQWIIGELVHQPLLQPTVAGTVQLEYEKSNGDYLEIEVFDNQLEIFTSLSNGDEALITSSEVSAGRINQELYRFYGNSND